MNIYLKRKIDNILFDWFTTEGHSPALIYGVRQCGKSRSILEFAKRHFNNVVSINFWTNPEAKAAFDGSLEVDDITQSLSYMFQQFKFVAKETVIIFDEIQDCPRARLALKSFKEDGRFEVIASGSYIGLNLYQKGKDLVPMPNGAEDVFCMKTMDFEEFLWAMGFSEDQVKGLLQYVSDKKPIPLAIHEKLKTVFKQYMCVGGYPESVSSFLNQNSFSAAFRKNESLIFDIKGDPIKRKNDMSEPLYTATEISRIQKAFDLTLSFALSENKRFIVSKIGGNSYQRNDAVDYLLNANVVFKVNNVENPSLPLAVKKISSDFKLYYADIAIAVTLCGFDTLRSLMEDKLGMNKGNLFEAAVADSLYKAGIPTYYFAKNGSLQIDFLIAYKGCSTLIEAKAKSGNVKSSKIVLAHPEHYGPTRLIKFGDYNIGYENQILTLPYYLAFALGHDEIEC